jgi:hypothetical protein
MNFERAAMKNVSFERDGRDGAVADRGNDSHGGEFNFRKWTVQMVSLRKFWKTLMAAVIALQLTACSKTVQWEEEVPLNTGETIWVSRKIEYALQSGFANPFSLGMFPTREQELQFSYAGQAYSYKGRANLILLAISPTKQPNLIAPAADFGWANEGEHKYSCVVPFYVQLVPDSTGKKWTWPLKPEPWLYGLSANLMRTHPNMDEHRKERYSTKDRDQRDSTYRLQFPPGAAIDPTYKEGLCVNYQPEMKNGK